MGVWSNGLYITMLIQYSEMDKQLQLFYLVNKWILDKKILYMRAKKSMLKYYRL